MLTNSGSDKEQLIMFQQVRQVSLWDILTQKISLVIYQLYEDTWCGCLEMYHLNHFSISLYSTFR